MPNDIPDGADYWWPRTQEPKPRDTECPDCHKMFCGQDGLAFHRKAKH